MSASQHSEEFWEQVTPSISQRQEQDEFYTDIFGDFPYRVNALPEEQDPEKVRLSLDSLKVDLQATVEKLRKKISTQPQLEKYGDQLAQLDEKVTQDLGHIDRVRNTIE